MNAVTPERVTLYYREGSSDKVYQAAIEPAGSQFVVNFAYGRRGATLTTGTKTSSPVDYDTAKKIFTKLVNEKKNHPKTPYTEGENGTPYQHTDKQASGILPQLLNPKSGYVQSCNSSPFTTTDESRNVAALAVLSMGESWHNLHHAYPTSARHGVLRGQLDSSARIIWLMEKFGWAKKVRWPAAAKVSALTVPAAPSSIAA